MTENAPEPEKQDMRTGAEKIKEAASHAKESIKEAAAHPKETLEHATERVKEQVREAPEKIKQAAKDAEKGLYKKLDDAERLQGGNDKNISMFGALSRGASRVEEKHRQRGTEKEAQQKEKHYAERREKVQAADDAKRNPKPEPTPEGKKGSARSVGEAIAASTQSNSVPAKKSSGQPLPPRPFSGGILTSVANSGIGNLGIRPGRGSPIGMNSFIGNIRPLSGFSIAGTRTAPVNFGFNRTAPVNFGFNRTAPVNFGMQPMAARSFGVSTLPQYRNTDLMKSPLFSLNSQLNFGKMGKSNKSEKGKSDGSSGKSPLERISSGKLNLFGRK